MTLDLTSDRDYSVFIFGQYNRDVYLREVIAANLYLTSLDVSFSGFVQPWLDKVKILDHSLHQ